MAYRCARFPQVVLAMALAWGFIAAAPALAQDIPAGTDCWQTESGTTVELPEIPEGFFGMRDGVPSDAIPGGTRIVPVVGLPLPPDTCTCDDGVELIWVDVHGNPVQPGDIHAVGQIRSPTGPYDTCIRRLEAPGFTTAPESVSIEIQLIELSLVSVEPIVVSFGTAPPDFFHVFITEDGVQASGQLQLNADELGPAPHGTMVLEGLPIQFQVQFMHIEGLINLGMVGGTNLQGTGGSFHAVIDVPALRGWGGWLPAGALLLVLSALFVRRQVTRA